MSEASMERAAYRITSKNPFGYSSYKRARAAQGARRGYAIWFNHKLGWYLKRADYAYGRAGARRALAAAV